MNTAGARIAFQGELGAYSHQACLKAYPEMEPLPCHTFEGAIAAVREGRAALAMLPVENSSYGRVADIHSLLPGSGLYIIGEYFLRVHISLLGVPGAKLEDITEAVSHTVLLGQCRAFLERHGIARVAAADTAGAAAEVAQGRRTHRAALASALAAELSGLEILAENIEDNPHNTTRFLIMSPRKIEAAPSEADVVTTFVFQVRNLPAALYKALGGFATNGVNMTKLESYMVDGRFTATQFLAEITGHPEHPAVARAFDELRYFSTFVTILGVFPAAEYRRQTDAL
ncbi:MAG: prephenate dehydratase [Alphaproteobacteria bacterium]|nr:MAG: prephenate dehydratase [Alphaproteobacteria bacterium]